MSKLLFHHINQLVNKLLFHQNWNLRSKMLLHQKWKFKIKLSNNLCGLKLTSMKVCNIDWKFWLKNDGLDCFRIYIHYIKCKEKKLYKIYFVKFFLLQYLKSVKVCKSCVWLCDFMFSNTCILFFELFVCKVLGLWFFNYKLMFFLYFFV